MPFLLDTNVISAARRPEKQEPAFQDFMRDFVRKSGSSAVASLPNVPRGGYARRFKRAVYAFGRYPTGDLERWEPNLPSQIAMDAESGGGAGDVE